MQTGPPPSSVKVVGLAADGITCAWPASQMTALMLGVGCTPLALQWWLDVLSEAHRRRQSIGGERRDFCLWRYDLRRRLIIDRRTSDEFDPAARRKGASRLQLIVVHRAFGYEMTLPLPVVACKQGRRAGPNKCDTFEAATLYSHLCIIKHSHSARGEVDRDCRFGFDLPELRAGCDAPQGSR